MRDFIGGTLEEFRFTKDWRYGSKSISLGGVPGISGVQGEQGIIGPSGSSSPDASYGVSPEDLTIDFWTRFNRLEETVQHEWDE